MTTQVESLQADILVLCCLVARFESDHRAGAVRLNFNIINLNFSFCRATKEALLIVLPFLASHFLSLEVWMIAVRVG